MMSTLFNIYSNTKKYKELESKIGQTTTKIKLDKLVGSSSAAYLYSYFLRTKRFVLCILPDKEAASYFYNDMENLFDEADKDIDKKNALFLPTSFKTQTNIDEPDPINQLSRMEVISGLSHKGKNFMLITYPEAIVEKSITPQVLKRETMNIKVNTQVSFDTLSEYLQDNGYERVDFVIEPGQFAIRGGIFDIYSFNNEYPFRIELFGDDIESIRSFNPTDQLSVKSHSSVSIIPNFSDKDVEKQSIMDVIPENSLCCLHDVDLILPKIDSFFNTTSANTAIDKEHFLSSIDNHTLITTGINNMIPCDETITFDTEPQPGFNKNFDLLFNFIEQHTNDNYTIFICSEAESQTKRIKNIAEEFSTNHDNAVFAIEYVQLSLQGGYVDNDNLLVLLTDHQIFDRYFKYKTKERFDSRKAQTIKELTSLNTGDYVTHIDFGIGRFDGLQKINNNGKEQEAIRILYANNDVLYVNIHSLYKISKYSSAEGHVPKINRLGSQAWNKLKNETKKKVKDIAQGLIKLYAERKNSDGFAFSQDTYMQHELEASFMFEDTPDQVKATADVKADMEKPYPMERLICGDVGFGKTEIAIRAAFKAAADSKQVAVLVPTTILAFQHYNTFTSRLKNFPVNIEYINRFKTTKQKNEILQNVESGKTDILIGTHILLNKKTKFKNLGLLIVDEEQKFGVSAKEKLKEMKVNVDTLTLTATPIPRTLQFSLMGARDLSILQTPPPNRLPVQTELHTFSEEIIKKAIEYELNRNGQIFFIHNKIQNIEQVKDMILKIVPGVSIAIGHGQLDGKDLEKIMMDFIEGKYDILLCTTIVESGLDIPNVNTIIIDDAQNFGLSELHQLRGRVGRSNKKSFCYLIAPPLSTLTSDASKRLRTIEEFSNLGSGFNIAMRDLDIRGAGDILGAEQSGFISDIGFETYQKILNEAISELKTEMHTDIADSDLRQDTYAKDCQIDTDIEALIPNDYISNLSERLSMYRQINELKTPEDFITLKENMKDRFGSPVPQQIDQLFTIIKIKNTAIRLGIEKIIIKQDFFKCYFLASTNETFYNSEVFNNIIKYVQVSQLQNRIGEKNGKMTLQFIATTKKPYTLTDVYDVIEDMANFNQE